MAKGKEVAVQEPKGSTAVAAYDYGADAGAGFQNHGKDDYAIPFIGVLQALSPQIETIDGAKAGMLINTVTNELVKGADGVPFGPVATKHCFVEWKPREQGGGLVATFDLNADVVVSAKEKQKFGEYKTPAGNDLVETFYVYGLASVGGTWFSAALAFTSTKIKKYKAWMTRARSIQIDLGNGRRINPPLFAHRFRLKSVKEKNNSGEFYNFDVTFDGANAEACRLAPADPLYQQARGMASLVESGAVKAAEDTQRATGDTGKEEGAAPF
jgi:hypothetical protein